MEPIKDKNNVQLGIPKYLNDTFINSFKSLGILTKIREIKDPLSFKNVLTLKHIHT